MSIIIYMLINSYFNIVYIPKKKPIHKKKKIKHIVKKPLLNKITIRVYV
jgi:hypothetical protein